MKKLAAILLLTLLAFNWYGYRLLSTWLEQHATQAIEEKLDKHQYAESDLIEFRIPLELPYQMNWKDFERYNGEVEINGIHYKYVKRKVEAGNLVVLCIPNDTKSKLRTSRDDFFKLVNDLQQAPRGKQGEPVHQHHFKGLSTEYWQSIAEWKLLSFEAVHAINFSSPPHATQFGYVTTCEQPPDA